LKRSSAGLKNESPQFILMLIVNKNEDEADDEHENEASQ
jgi:hypothetical protein